MASETKIGERSPIGTLRKRLTTRATQAVMQAGLKVSCVEVRPDGTVLVHTVDRKPETDEAMPTERGTPNGRPQPRPRIDKDKAEEWLREVLVREKSGAGH